MIAFFVARLDKGPVSLEGSEPPEFLDLPEGDVYDVVSDVKYDLEVNKVSGGALVTGRCCVTISGTCGRCLVPVEQEVSASDISFFLDLEEAKDEVDISEDIRSELLLELPMILLCDESCLGLCPECGCDLNKEECSCNGPRGSLAWGELDKLDL